MVILGPFDQEEVHLRHHSLSDLQTKLVIQSHGRRPWTFTMLPPDVFKHCEGSRREVYRQHRNATCRCNATHGVTYTSEPDVAADVAVHVVGGIDDLPSITSIPASTQNFLLYMEAPHNLNFASAPGFDGVVGFRRPAGAEAAVWHPWCSHEQAWSYPAAWQLDLSRDDVGVWLSNCQGYNELWRTSVIDALIGSGLKVSSYGDCRKTVAPELRATALGLGMHSRDGQRGYCWRHRVMLAVENNACHDWISDNLCQALQCGAIPVIKSIWSHNMPTPDYQAIYGDEISALVVNASRPGWLTEVRALMTNDTEYALRHQRWVEWARAVLAGRSRRPRADPGNWHCQWYRAVAAAARARSAPAVLGRGGSQAPHATWQNCSCPAGATVRQDFAEERSGANAKLRHRSLPTCATPPE